MSVFPKIVERRERKVMTVIGRLHIVVAGGDGGCLWCEIKTRQIFSGSSSKRVFFA